MRGEGVSGFPINELSRLATAGRVARLDPQERAVVVLRLGWDREGETRSQAETAEALGLSQPTISALEREAKEKLKVMGERVEWFHNHDTVVSLAMWLDHNYRFDTPGDAIHLFEKPWHYENEYQEMLAADALEEANA